MELIDIGVNLAHDSFDADRGAVLEAARHAGVAQMVVTGSSFASIGRALELVHSHPGQLFATAGIHPHHATELPPARAAELQSLALQPGIVAVGECGLDYFRDLAPREAQRSAFALQLELAARLRKPVFLHQRAAHADFVAMLTEHRAGLAGGVAHCFTGGARELEAYLELGLLIGITGWVCDERRGVALKMLLKDIPAQRLLLETDAPYLLPRDLAPKPASRRNEPKFLRHIAQVVAQARAQSVEELAAASTAAARALFALPPARAPGLAEDE
jgi:TatD DNase family protein